MAIKDWELVKNNAFQKVYYNKKDSSRILLNYEGKSFGHKTWSFHHNKDLKEDRLFNSKQICISYARKYMRKH